MHIDELLGPDNWEDLPEDADEAFAHVIKVAQRASAPKFNALHAEARESDDWSQVTEAQFGYIGSIIGVAKGLDVEAFRDYYIPDIRDFDSQFYKKFVSDINHFSAQVAAKRAVRARNLTVRLSEKSASSIRTYVHHLKEAVDKANMTDAKKASLHQKLRDFESELDVGRKVNFLRVSLLCAEIIGIPGSIWQSGEVATRLANNIMQSVAEERHVQIENKVAMIEDKSSHKLTLPQYEERKPTPKHGPRESYDLNDDIPF